MAFLNTPRFPENISYGSKGGPIFKTSIVQTYSGHEERNADWEYPLYRYDIKEGIRNMEDLYEVYEHFMAVNGRLNSFRFKDWFDFTSGDAGVSATSTDQIIGSVGVSTTFVIVKNYTKGAMTFQRRIYKPVTGTVLVNVGGSDTNDFTVNYTSGIITLTSSFASGAVRVGYEFDVPVRFESDIFMAGHDFYRVMSADLYLSEVRL